MCHTQIIYNKVNEFWKSDKYCDVTIEVQEKSFKCHRLLLAAASEYFDIMFGGNFLEGRTNNIVLKERDIDALSFEQVLCYIYAGGVALTKYNVFDTLRASRFFQIGSLEEECIGFIQNNLPVCEMLEVFKYANLINEKSLVECTSRYIMEYFNEFDHDRFFLELSFEDLCTLFLNRLYLFRKNERPFVNAIFRWVNYTRDTRVREFEEMTKKYLPEESAKSDLLKLIQEISRRPNASDDNAESDYTDCADLNILIKPKWDLHFYFSSKYDGATNVYSLDRKMSYGSISCSIPENIYALTAVGVGDYLYFLGFFSRETLFQACPSVEFTFKSPTNRQLQCPSNLGADLKFNNQTICNIRNKIYLNSNNDDYEASRARYTYVYNVDIDKWLFGSVTEVNRACSTIVTYNDVLYRVQCCGLVQALDDRTSKWQKLNTVGDCKCVSLFARPRFYSCVHDGKIYNSNDYRNSELRRYDLTASKWEKITPMNEIDIRKIKLISYENLLWAVGKTEYGLQIKTYNSLLDKWSPLSTIDKFMRGDFHEAVVFKPI